MNWVQIRGSIKGADIMGKELKEKVCQEYFRRVKLLAKLKLYGDSLIKGVYIWAVNLVGYTTGN